MIAKYLNSLQKPLADFLKKVLPPIYNKSDDWWDKSVLMYLDEFEYKKIEDNEIGDFKRIDIKCLLKILNKNWQLLSNYYNSYNLEDFTYFGIFSNVNKECSKKMIDLRNKWAHQDLVYTEANNYINVLLRFAKFIEAKNIVIQQLEIDANLQKITTKINRDELVKFLEDNVITPAEKSKNSTTEIKRKIKHTREQIAELETAEEVENYFWHLMTSVRGFDTHKKFKECGLTTFEDVRDKFAILCGIKNVN